MWSSADFAGVQTFKYRQSSLISEPFLDPCMGRGPNLVAGRTPSHLAAGCGARQRRSPTGGAANGTPRYTVSVASLVPCNTPCSTLAVVLAATLMHGTAAMAIASKTNFMVVFLSS